MPDVSKPFLGLRLLSEAVRSLAHGSDEDVGLVVLDDGHQVLAVIATPQGLLKTSPANTC